MKCPLFRVAQLLQPRETAWKDIDCLKEDCAVWDKDNSQCVAITIGHGIWILDQLVTGIVNKMPHAG